MVSSKFRVGVIGVGRMGERHCRVYSGLPEVDFVGVSDMSPRRGMAVAEAYGARFFPDYGDLLREVDAVSVATPTPAHGEVARECLRQRVPALIEKPLAADLAEARALVRLAHETSTLLQVGHIERFNPAFLEVQGIVQDLAVVALNTRRLSPFDTSNTDVDVVLDLMIHDIDLMLALLGDQVESIRALGRPARSSSVDYAVATVGMASGAIANLTSSRVTEQKVRLLEITALGAYVEVDLLVKSVLIHRRTLPEYLVNQQKPLRYRQESFVEHIQIPTAEPLALELRDFVRCVRDGTRPRVTGEEGLRALEVAACIRDQLRAALPERSPTLLTS